MSFEEILFAPIVLFIRWPLAALVPAAAFGWGYYVSRKRWPLIAAIVWALYAIYESLMKARILCSGECNIRVDLLLLYPILAVLTVGAIVQLLRKRRNA
jgi:hypothetical protein